MTGLKFGGVYCNKSWGCSMILPLTCLYRLHSCNPSTGCWLPPGHCCRDLRGVFITWGDSALELVPAVSFTITLSGKWWHLWIHFFFFLFELMKTWTALNNRLKKYNSLTDECCLIVFSGVVETSYSEKETWSGANSCGLCPERTLSGIFCCWDVKEKKPNSYLDSCRTLFLL